MVRQQMAAVIFRRIFFMPVKDQDTLLVPLAVFSGVGVYFQGGYAVRRFLPQQRKPSVKPLK
jgi:hypothetical protein